MSSTRRETIAYEKSGLVARLTLNRPDRLNGMTNRMFAACAPAASQPKLRSAAMRKLLLILNAMLKTQTPWTPPCPA